MLPLDVLSAGIGTALFGIGAAIAAFAAAYGIGKIGQATLEAGARQPEYSSKFQSTAIIIGALVEGACLFAILICLLGVLK